MPAGPPISVQTLGHRDLDALPLFPLPDVVLFPGALLPLHVFEPRYRQLVADALDAGGALALPRLRPGFEGDYHGSPAVYPVCGAGRIVRHERLPDGRYHVLVVGLERVRLERELPSSPYRRARARRLMNAPSQPPEVLTAWAIGLRGLVERLRPHLRAEVEQIVETSDACLLSDQVAAAVVADADERQRLLEQLDPAERVVRLTAHVRELIDRLEPDRAPDYDLN